MWLMLPTTELIREHQRFDPLFCFYHEGIKGLVRDIAVLSDGGALYTPHNVKDLILEKVDEEYEVCFDSRYNDHTLPPNFEYPSLAVIELITERLVEDIVQMMQCLLHQRYEVSFDHRDQVWIADDLVVLIKDVEPC